MHFSRNPPGPNTSCIEGFAESSAGASRAPSRAPPVAVWSSSMGTYSRSAVFAARFTFAPVEPPAELDARLARNPPSLSPDEWERPVTITYPLPSALSAARPQAAGHCISLDSGHLALEHPLSFCRDLLLLPALHSAVGC